MAVSLGFNVPKAEPWFELTKLGPVSSVFVTVKFMSCRSSETEILSKVTLLKFCTRIV